MVFMMTLNKLKEDSIKNNIPIVKNQTLVKILDVIEKENIKNILEIGAATGYSAINFALLNKDIKVYTIEKDEIRFLEAIKNIKAFNLENQIKIVNLDANNLLDSDTFIEDYLTFLGESKFDMLFIDAAKGQYLNFLKKGLKFLKINGFIIADNVLFKGYVLGDYKEKKHRTIVNNLREFIVTLNNNTKFETEIFNIDDGLLISKIKTY